MSNPLIKFHSFVICITTLLVFSFWSFLTSIETSYTCLKVPIAALASIGVYRLCLYIFGFIVLKIRRIKKFVFGSYYVEGVWIGFFYGKKGEIRYYIETFEQDFNSIVIRGKGFREDKLFFGTWITEEVSLNVKKGTLSYTYLSDAKDTPNINSGLAYFTIDRKNKDSKPERLIGYSCDLYNPIKLISLEEKISDNPKIKDIEEILNQAVEFSENNKSFHPATNKGLA